MSLLLLDDDQDDFHTMRNMMLMFDKNRCHHLGYVPRRKLRAYDDRHHLFDDPFWTTTTPATTTSTLNDRHNERQLSGSIIRPSKVSQHHVSESPDNDGNLRRGTDEVPEEPASAARRGGRIIPIQHVKAKQQHHQHPSRDDEIVVDDHCLVDFTSGIEYDDEEFEQQCTRQHRLNTRPDYDGHIPSHLRSTLRQHFERIVDVPSDGHCGYHVLMDGLIGHKLLPPHIQSVTDFRKAIVDYAIENRTKLLKSSPNNYFHVRGVWNFRNDDVQKTRQNHQFLADLQQIYDPIKARDGGYDRPVSQDDWIKSYVVMPLVSQMFGINIWILSVHGDYYCGYDISSSNQQPQEYTTMFQYRPATDSVECIRYENCAKFPNDRKDSGEDDHKNWTSVPTIYTLHVNQNHYVRGVPFSSSHERS